MPIYQSCCVEASAQVEFIACPSCGTPLWRCRRPGCPGLVDELEHCAVCTWPIVAVNLVGDLTQGRRGAVELKLWNRGRAPFEVTLVRYRFASDEDWREREISVPAPPGSEERLLLDGFEPRTAGDYVLFIEALLETGDVQSHFRVESLLERVREGLSGKQEIHVHGDIVASDRAVVSLENKDYSIDATEVRMPDYGQWQIPPVRRALPLDRLRFARAGQPAVSRATRIAMPHVETGRSEEAGFHRGRLGFGRNRPERSPEVDFLLRAWPYDDERNRELTRAVSGLHFELFPNAGRLWARDRSSNGTTVNGRPVGRGLRRALRPDDVISPFTDPADIMHRSWRVVVRGSGDRAQRVELRPNW